MSDEIVEISKSRLALLEGVSKLNNDLWNDPSLGPKVKELVKEKYPNANIPEVDMARASKKTESDILGKVEEAKKETMARIEAFEKSQKERDEKDSNAKAEREFASEMEEAKRKYQLTSEGMEKVISRMREKNNPDVESAAAWVTDHEPKMAPTVPSNYSDPSFNPFGSKGTEDKKWEMLNKNPWDGRFAETEISEIMNNFANGRGDLYGANGMGGQL